MFEVQKKDQTVRKERERKYPFQRMQIGDSFLVPNGTIGRTAVAKAMFLAEREGLGMFVSRSVPEGVRVWRFA